MGKQTKYSLLLGIESDMVDNWHIKGQRSHRHGWNNKIAQWHRALGSKLGEPLFEFCSWQAIMSNPN